MQELQGASILWWGLILAGNAKFISAFIDISFVFDPLIVDVRCLLDALNISIWFSRYLQIFSLGYGWDGCQENKCGQRHLYYLACSISDVFIVSSFRNLATPATNPLAISVMGWPSLLLLSASA